MTDTPTINVDIYQSQAHTKHGKAQRWRWRAINAANNKIMAQASEAYTNKADCLDAIHQLFSTDTAVTLRQAGADNTTIREAAADWQLKLP